MNPRRVWGWEWAGFVLGCSCGEKTIGKSTLLYTSSRRLNGGEPGERVSLGVVRGGKEGRNILSRFRDFDNHVRFSYSKVSNSLATCVRNEQVKITIRKIRNVRAWKTNPCDHKAVREALGFYPASHPLYPPKQVHKADCLRVKAAPRLASSGKEARS
jgi:hypothetical protein